VPEVKAIVERKVEKLLSSGFLQPIGTSNRGNFIEPGLGATLSVDRMLVICLVQRSRLGLNCPPPIWTGFDHSRCGASVVAVMPVLGDVGRMFCSKNTFFLAAGMFAVPVTAELMS
jgi:hypothetical protein